MITAVSVAGVYVTLVMLASRPHAPVSGSHRCDNRMRCPGYRSVSAGLTGAPLVTPRAPPVPRIVTDPRVGRADRVANHASPITCAIDVVVAAFTLKLFDRVIPAASRTLDVAVRSTRSGSPSGPVPVTSTRLYSSSPLSPASAKSAPDHSPISMTG